MSEGGDRKIYLCLRCGRLFALSDIITPGIHCPYCSYRIIIKVRSFQAKRMVQIQ